MRSRASIERGYLVRAADITDISIGRGFLYLVAVMDWASRAVLSWRLLNTMDVSFCVPRPGSRPGSPFTIPGGLPSDREAATVSRLPSLYRLSSRFDEDHQRLRHYAIKGHRISTRFAL